MAGETVLIPKDKYERLLKLAAMYHEVSKNEVADQVTQGGQPAAVKNNSNSETPVSHNHRTPNIRDPSMAADSDEADQDTPSGEPTELESKTTKPLRPPGLPLKDYKNHLNRLKRTANKKSSSKTASKIKKSKEWLTW